jgi:hypothetical protein
VFPARGPAEERRSYRPGELRVSEYRPGGPIQGVIDALLRLNAGQASTCYRVTLGGMMDETAANVRGTQ